MTFVTFYHECGTGRFELKAAKATAETLARLSAETRDGSAKIDQASAALRLNVRDVAPAKQLAAMKRLDAKSHSLVPALALSLQLPAAQLRRKLMKMSKR